MRRPALSKEMRSWAKGTTQFLGSLALIGLLAVLGAEGRRPYALAQAGSGPAGAPPRLGFYLKGLKPWGEPAASDFANVVELSGSRGETLNFTLRAGPAECFEPALRLTASIGAASLPRLRPAFYEILPFVTEHPSYHGAKPGTYWDPVLPRERFCPGKAGQWILGEIRIPEAAQRGQYEGRITAGALSLPFKLKVWGMTMPEKPAIPLYAELTTWFALLGHYGQWHEGESQLAAQYISRMLEHRIVPTKHGVRPIPLGPRMAELKTIDGHPSPDSFESAVVKPLPEWAGIPVPFGQDRDPSKPETAEFVSKVHAAVERAGWLDRAYAYLWDEPGKSDFATLKRLAGLVREKAPGIKILVTTLPQPDLEPLVDIWVPIVDALGEGKDKLSIARIAELRGQGKQVWAYASCVSHGCGNDVDSGAPDWVIDRPGTHIRSQGWLAQKFGLDALLYYSVDNGYQFYNQRKRDPWKSLWDFTGNGDGTLFYPGRPGEHGLTEHVPVESLRLKLWRQSSYDADYVQWLKQAPAKPSWWPTRLDQLIRGAHDWEHDDKPYRELREQIGDYLDQARKSAQRS